MIGAILTGGYGKRMQGVSSDIPKNLLPLKNGYLILDRQLRDFRIAGIGKVYMLTGYRGEMIESRYGSEWNGMEIMYLTEDMPKGTLWSVRNLFQHTNEDILLRNGDTICDVDLREVVDFYSKKMEMATMIVTRMVSPYGIVEMRGDRVKSFMEKPVLNHYINAGTYVLSRRMEHYLSLEYVERDMERTVFTRMAEEGEIAAFKYGGFWRSIDSLKDYEEVTSIYTSREDFDFGSIVRKNQTVILDLLSGKRALLRGTGSVKVLSGKVDIAGMTVGKGEKVDIAANVAVDSITASSVLLSGSITAETSGGT